MHINLLPPSTNCTKGFMYALHRLHRTGPVGLQSMMRRDGCGKIKQLIQCHLFEVLFHQFFFLLKIITLPLTSEGPGSANGVITVAKGMLEACSKSLLHGILYIVLLMKRGLQFPEKKKNTMNYSTQLRSNFRPQKFLSNLLTI